MLQSALNAGMCSSAALTHRSDALWKRVVPLPIAFHAEYEAKDAACVDQRSAEAQLLEELGLAAVPVQNRCGKLCCKKTNEGWDCFLDGLAIFRYLGHVSLCGAIPDVKMLEKDGVKIDFHSFFFFCICSTGSNRTVESAH